MEAMKLDGMQKYCWGHPESFSDSHIMAFPSQSKADYGGVRIWDNRNIRLSYVMVSKLSMVNWSN